MRGSWNSSGRATNALCLPYRPETTARQSPTPHRLSKCPAWSWCRPAHRERRSKRYEEVGPNCASKARTMTRPRLGLCSWRRVQTITFPIIQKYVDEVVLVSEDEIKAAIHGLLSREKLVAEGSAAAAFAAVATGKIRMDGAAVAVITGGNIDLQTL